VKQLSKLPDIGPRAATRLAFYLMNQNQEELEKLSELIKNLKRKVHLCSQCFNITSKENDSCSICSDIQRNKDVICVVETILNIPPIERTKQFTGVYHVLGGLISPGNGLSPENLKINELVKRIKKDNSPNKEIIFALSPTTEGDTTFLYIERMIKPLNIKISRLARGLSFGSDLEYIDESTLSSAFRGRR
ncbi:recombination mediator RecR, partial [Patescibacteria group bacterium]|nr:recombination mediator RecR [Patescibacteria group bacterium]